MPGNAISNLGAGAVGALSLTQHEQTARREAKEQEVHGNNIIQDLVIPPRQRHHRSPQTLQDDGDDRNVGGGVNRSHAAKEDAVFSHGEVDARRSQYGLAQESESGNGNSQG